MSWESVWSVLKWVLAALAAGFVGQFGRSFAIHLIQRRRAKKADSVPGSRPPGESRDAQVETRQLEAEAKLEKKRAKAEVKRLKKSSNKDDGATPS